MSASLPRGERGADKSEACVVPSDDRATQISWLALGVRSDGDGSPRSKAELVEVTGDYTSECILRVAAGPLTPITSSSFFSFFVSFSFSF